MQLSRFHLCCALLGAALLILLALPLINMILTADPAVLIQALRDAEVISSIGLTLRAALSATLAGLLLGIPLAYTLARLDFPGKSLVQGLVDLPVMIPHTAMGVALLMIYGKKFLLGSLFGKMGISFIGTETGISLAMAYVSMPYLINAARDGFAGIDPKLEKVARTLGASPWQTFFRISLPLARPAILSGAIMMWARGISEFGAVVILAYHPMVAPILIWERFESYGLKYARPVAVLLILVCLFLFALLRAVAGQRRGN
jgi:molybdate/tungstate transport system permease protein